MKLLLEQTFIYSDNNLKATIKNDCNIKKKHIKKKVFLDVVVVSFGYSTNMWTRSML